VTSRRFMVVAFATALCCVLSLAASSYLLDAYGLFGRRAHPAVVAYRGERTTKYLLSYKYIPENFDSLLVGASISLNMDTKKISVSRVYNASISGANIFEEGLIAENVMARTKLDWLVVCLHPYLTMTHGRRTEYMTPDEYWSAFGSIGLFVLEASGFMARHGLAEDHHNEFGDSNYREGLSAEQAQRAMNAYVAERERSGVPSPNFTLAPGALDDLVRMLETAKHAGTRILLVYPPIYKARFDVERNDWERYWARVRPLFPADTLVIDFNSSRFDAMRSDISNFQDSGHLDRHCADQVVLEIARTLSAQPRSAGANIGRGVMP